MQESPENLNTQAIELAAEGSFPEAVACLKRALVIEKENYLLWYNLGVTYRNAGDLYSARQVLLKAIELNDTDADVFETLGLVCFALQDYSESLTYYVAGLDIDENNAHLWNNLGVLHFTCGEYDTASAAFEEAVTIYPHYYDALFNLRDTYVELGNETGASICEEKLHGLTPPQN